MQGEQGGVVQGFKLSCEGEAGQRDVHGVRTQAQGSAGDTHVLRDGDEADAADREMTVAVPAG